VYGADRARLTVARRMVRLLYLYQLTMQLTPIVKKNRRRPWSLPRTDRPDVLFKKVHFLPNDNPSTSDPAHVLHRYDTDLRAKFRRCTSSRFGGDRKHAQLSIC